MSNKTLSQFKGFLLVGIVSVCLDWGFYFIFIQVINVDSTIAKALSYSFGTLFAFFFNGLFTFKSRLILSKLLKHLSLYGGSLIVNTFVFSILDDAERMNSKTISYLSLLGATVVSMTMNFIGMRFWVFKNYLGKNAHR